MTSLSVVLCTYNGATFLPEQLASVAAQTRPPDDMVIRDDGSTDGTMQILEQFAARVDFPVSIAKNPVRRGAFQNFWGAIPFARGDLIALCDQDDIWKSTKLEHAVTVLDSEPEVGATFSDGLCIDATGTLIGKTVWDGVAFSNAERARFEAGADLDILFRHPVVTGATLTFRAALLPPLVPGPNTPHDYWLSTAVAMRSMVLPIREPLVNYRLHSSNTTGISRRSRFGYRFRYAFDPKYRRDFQSTRLSLLEDFARLASEAPSPRVTTAQRASLRLRIERLRTGVSLPETPLHWISFVRRS